MLTSQELNSLLDKEWSEKYSIMTNEYAMQIRAIRIRGFTQELKPLTLWPKKVRRILFKRFPLYPPIGSKDIFHLFLFFFGNGYPAHRAGTWLLTYFALTSWHYRDGLAGCCIQRIVKLYDSFLNAEGDEWNYYDLERRQYTKFKDSTSCILSKNE